MDVILGVAIGLVAMWAILLVLFWALRPKGVPVRELLGLIPDVLRLLRSVIGDRSAPLDVRIVLVGLLAWILSPIDLIPEFVPVLGPLDDVVVAVVAMRYVRRRLGIEDLRRRWTGTDNGFSLLARVIGGSWATKVQCRSARQSGVPRVVDGSSRTGRASADQVREETRGNMSSGTVKKLVADRGFGFITADDGKDYFFHRGALEGGLDFDRLVGGEKVDFEVEASPKGPRAVKVREA